MADSSQTILLSIKDMQSQIKHLTEELILKGRIRDELLETARLYRIPEEEIRSALDT